ncbi:PspC domain-containing protein [Flavobacterium sp.]|uniref:PspC domain-containing protein n=1 Tax=Flavobacterium sp. TaxID=239 RepID=UPI00286E22E0|nr:PspC domain-containing protein [Flavobacterium sp.]
MNKTVNMNLGGFFFHIDEDAYQKLNRYFDAIKRSLSNDGREEIMNDIESRISELFSEKITSEKQVLGIKEIDDVIAVMGQPEDYKIEDEPKQENFSTIYNPIKTRKLYRDVEGGIIGGVLSGFGHYFGIDKIWLRLIMLILLLTFGSGVVVYIIFWIIMPEAKTTSEKLEMRGEPINISNIEKKVREEFDSISDKIKNADYDKMGTQFKSGAEKIGGAVETVFPKLFEVFGKVLGGFIVFIAASVIIGSIVAFFTIGTFQFLDTPFLEHAEIENFSGIPMWLIIFLSILAGGIPFIFLLILGLKLLVTNLRSIGNTAKYTLLGLWIVSIIILIGFGIKQGTESAYEGRISEKQTLNLNPSDTLRIKFKYNDMYAKGFYNDDNELVQDASNKNLIYSNEVTIEILESNETTPYIQIEKLAEGKSLSDARQRAEKIKYSYKIEGNELVFDNYWLTDVENKFRDQEVKIYLYLPKGIVFKADKSVQEYDDSENDYFNLHHSSDDYIYKVESNKIKCLNCPDEETYEYNDGNNDQLEEDLEDIIPSNVTINKNGISITNDTINSNSKDIKELKINKDGIIIKTN